MLIFGGGRLDRGPCYLRRLKMRQRNEAFTTKIVDWKLVDVNRKIHLIAWRAVIERILACCC